MRRRIEVSQNLEKESEVHPIIIPVSKLKYIVGVSIVVLVIQLFGIKYFFDQMKSTEPLEERTPWEAVKLLLENSEKAELPIFVIEPTLIRAVREGSKRRVELWNQQPQSTVTFGVMESDIDVLHKVVAGMQAKGYTFWEKQDEDPRHVFTAIDRAYRVIVTHILLWVPVELHTPMLIHLVIFFERQNYFWHAVAEDKLHKPPFNISQSLFGKTAGSYSLFELAVVHIDGVKVQWPKDSSAFLQETKSSEFIDCNHTQVHNFNIQYGLKKKRDDFVLFQRKARQLLFLAKKVLNSLGIPFWLSSGTCLGWYRQCDVIPYTTDVDIGIFIKDYQELLISTFESHGLMLTHYFGKVSDSLELSFLYGDLKLDIFFFYVTDDYMWNGGTQASTGNKYKYIFPPFHLCWTEFLELWVQVPCPTLPYIHANYGNKWMIPNNSWDWKKSPPNVIENGQWSEDEWEYVIQLYQ